MRASIKHIFFKLIGNWLIAQFNILFMAIREFVTKMDMLHAMLHIYSKCLFADSIVLSGKLEGVESLYQLGAKTMW